uniref:Centromere protein I n=1 Tax=Oncorhynchus tshawytscha TaxID=74940 RepID=A0A8C8CXT0_ONCTS
MPGELRKTLAEVVSAHAHNKRSRARFEFCLNKFVPEENTIHICFRYVAMAKAANLSRSDLDSSSGSDLSVSSRTSNRTSTSVWIHSELSVCFLVEAGTPRIGNDVLERNLVQVERVGLSRGLPPEAISVMLDYAMSLRGMICVRVLKFLIPATVVPQEAVVQAVAWLCVSKIAISTQVLFLRWLLTVFDMIDSKDNLRAIYGFIFHFVTEENLSPYICHLLYLLTRRESVRPFRVRKLLDLQTKMGRQPFLLHLLSLYKVFCPELVTLALPSQMRKYHHLEVPSLSSSVQRNSPSSSSRKVFALEQLHTFPQLLDNLHRIELPSQMGSLLGSSLALCYLDYVQDDSAFLRLNFWLGHALHEGTITNQPLRLPRLSLSLQKCEGFSSTEGFLYKFLNVWDGSLLRPQILGLLSDIPVVPSSCINQLLFEPLVQLFFTSTLFFKVIVNRMPPDPTFQFIIRSLHHTIISISSYQLLFNLGLNMSLSGFMDSVVELVRFVGRLAAMGLQLEGCHSLLLSFILDFYETVCDMFLKYGLPMVVMPPVGVFYPALFATDPVSVDRLGYIMYRYKKNLTSAKCLQKETKVIEQAFHISRQTYREFNHYLSFMVSCLWNSKMFLPGMAIEVDQELLSLSKVAKPWTSFDLIHHPAFLGYALDFHHKCWPERKEIDLNSIKAGKQWDWYLEFLFSQGFQGLQQFVQSSITRRSVAGTNDQGQGDRQPTNS